MKTKLHQIYLSILLILTILILLNILVARHFVRIDLTQNKQYTLSKATKTIIKHLDAPVTIVAYFSKQLPPQLITLRRQLINTLEDYRAVSKDKIIFQVLDPNKNQKLEQQAVREGISPLIVAIREKDQMKQQKVYMGLVIKYKDKKQVIPYISPNSSLEYLITSAIKKLTIKTKPEIGILQGFGCPTFHQMQGFINALSVMYKPVPLYFDSTKNNLFNYKVVAIIAPEDSIPKQLLSQIEQYLNNGGRLFLALNAVKGLLNDNPPMGVATNTGLVPWLQQQFNVKLYKSFIVDARCGNITIQQGNFPIPVQIPFPYFPIISDFANHPITKGLSAVMMTFASPIEFHGDSSKIHFKPIAFTSKNTGLENPPVLFSVSKNWSEADFPYHHLIVGAVLWSNKWRMTLFGDGDFMQFPAGERYEKSDNVSLAVNSIDWLSDDMGLIQLRAKGIKYHPLKQLKSSTKTLIKYANFIVPILIVLILGLIRIQKNKSKQRKLKNSAYVDKTE
jgi:gliding-associated putative ABC transporter substrate-binding component GldG